MRFSFTQSSGTEVYRPGRAVGSGILTAGVLSLVFGLAIIAAPQLLAYIVASFFIVAGISLLTTWYAMKK